jgi:hypothetical protein
MPWVLARALSLSSEQGMISSATRAAAVLSWGQEVTSQQLRGREGGWVHPEIPNAGIQEADFGVRVDSTPTEARDQAAE